MTDDDKDTQEKALLEERAELKTRMLAAELFATGLDPMTTLAAMLSGVLGELARLQESAEADRFLARFLAEQISASYAAADSEAKRILVDAHLKDLLRALAEASLRAGRRPLLVATVLVDVGRDLIRAAFGLFDPTLPPAGRA
jgi:hypothetical protein